MRIMTDLEYYRLCKRTDPTYTAYNAYKEYLSENVGEAEDIAREYWDNNNYDSEVFDWDTLVSYFDGMEPEDIFRLGAFATGYGDDDFNYSAPYFRFNGYGNIESVESYDYEDLIMDGAHDAFDSVMDEEISISDELEEVLRIFGYGGGEDNEPSYNRKSQARKNSPRKTAKKAPAKKKTAKPKMTKKTARGKS